MALVIRCIEDPVFDRADVTQDVTMIEYEVTRRILLDQSFQKMGIHLRRIREACGMWER